jgi:hypothetical protein
MAIRKLVVVKDCGFIPEIKASGPINTPTKIPTDTIKKMVVNGRSVYECNVQNTADRVKLTIHNVDKVNFATVAAAKYVEKLPEETPEKAPEETPVEIPATPDPVDSTPEEVQAPTDEVPAETPAEPTDSDNDADSQEADSENDEDAPNPDDDKPEDNSDAVQTSNKKKNKKRNK